MKNTIYFLGILFLLIGFKSVTYAQVDIPDIYSNIHVDEAGKLYLEYKGEKRYEYNPKSNFTLKNAQGKPKGTKDGIQFDFSDLGNELAFLYYGFIPYNDSKHPQPVYFHTPAIIKNAKTEIDIRNHLSGKYDMIGWKKTGKGTIGYRLMTRAGKIVYDGKISFLVEKNKIKIDNTITEGPLVNLLSESGVTISFETNYKLKAEVLVNGKTFSEKKKTSHHEIEITGLRPATRYSYTVRYGDNSQTYSFKTALHKGSGTAFCFAYASDSRSGKGGGERNLRGVNHYIMKKIAAMAYRKEAAFMQFTGDMINGYLMDASEMDLQYANWKNSIAPFAHYMPFIATTGNHEVMMSVFKKPEEMYGFSIDKFPFETQSAEAVFARNFVNPHNGLLSEDGASYDPNPNKMDFPPYDETVYYYTYGNAAMVVLNSNYLYAPSLAANDATSGNLHGYLMDNQLEWLQKTLQMLENDEDIDHVFVSQHTPAFPNGGHVKDDMWYNRNNEKRAVVAGKPLAKGIVERRDEYLTLLFNESTKVVAMLTGDEHNYCRLKLSPETDIYGTDYQGDKIKLSRTIYQINNGAAGAPYYAQETTPWSPSIEKFSTQNALVFFYIEGKTVKVKVLNPDTQETVDEYRLR